ncbi:MAG: VirB4 family type IV secretion system protein [Candidatus Dormibacteria bacterium]
MTALPRTIRVPLNVDAQFRLPMGPAVLPVRSLILAGVASPVAYALLAFRLPGLWGAAAAGFVLAAAASFGLPERQGVWIGTHLAYRHAWRVLPSTVTRGGAARARVREVDGSIHVSRERPLRTRVRASERWRAVASIPATSADIAGVLRLDPGGHRGILVLEGPPLSVSSAGYLEWCSAVIGWVRSLDCPVQFLTLMTHHDADRVGDAFDRRVAGWPRTPLCEIERELAGTLAETTLGLRHYLVLAPGAAGDDGVPQLAVPWRSRRARPATEQDAERVVQSALRMAPGFAVAARPADRDDIAALLAHTVLGAPRSLVGRGVLHVGERHHVVLTATRLPAVIEVGAVVDALTRAHAHGMASLHIYPVASAVAQKHLHRRSSMLRYAERRGADAVEAQVALQDTTEVVAALAQRDIVPCRVALTLSVAHSGRDSALQAAERLGAVLAAHGFHVTEVDGPGFLPALALAPGWGPLARSLVLTSDSVAARMLPCLGTPFADVGAPLVGLNVQNGTPAYFSVWSQPNHNLVVVGSSGAGKSVAAKTLLIRHVMEGVDAVVIDPDSEYRSVMQAVGGRYLELGVEALNPLEVAARTAPDAAAGLVLPILSVMAGDDRGVRDGRPIRRLPDEDQGWLHGELVDFFSARSGRATPALMRDAVEHLEQQSLARALTDRERDRCRIITARLRRFTQGRRAAVFDRPSTFAVGSRPIAIGLKSFAMTYGADLTPALAVLLTAILEALEKRRGRMIVVVDEAHRITSDPDAGEVLGQLVRQARKHGAGVWMLSQRVEDFVRTDLGRTLAATSSSKLVLGTEEAVVEDVREVFKLRDEEVAAICPSSQGRGVLLAGPERAVVSILPGPAIMALADTRAEPSRGIAEPARTW